MNYIFISLYYIYIAFTYLFIVNNFIPLIMPYPRYTKADLEEVVYTQLENLNAIHDLLRVMKLQNELIENANKKLKDEIIDFKKHVQYFPDKRKKRTL